MPDTTPPHACFLLRGPSPMLAVVVPVRNEADNILPLVAEIRAAVAGIPAEIIYVDDGSTDETPILLNQAAGAGGGLRHLRHVGSAGQSAAIRSGVRAATADWIATLDGDGQNDPADIPRLWLIAVGAADESAPVLIAGERTRRQDGLIKRLSSSIANGIRSRILNDRTVDTGCGLKLFRREDFLSLPQFDHMHRFLPALFLRAGGRVVSVPVNHRARTRGRSNYGTFDRLWVGLFDLVGVFWLQRRPARVRAVEVEASAPAEPSR